MKDHETVRARVSRLMKESQVTQSKVHFHLLAEKGAEVVSLAHVARILRGASDQGEKADRIRAAAALLCGTTVEAMFEGALLQGAPNDRIRNATGEAQDTSAPASEAGEP